ncbi:hypothetical protein [Flectobacillus roseus]|uniref:hypothetical protein n=1 Tax=Flectobacillus roseus TaxID=502259 RepID=UPI0024B65E45|nr:hypothetical protein [Flectobacillus roseus]MDI9872632.1 hypothetical protein [Flectobacillus roseus]
MKRILTSGGIHEFLLMNEHEAKDLYHRKNFTARQLAEHFHIHFTPAFQKECHIVLGSKGMGRGGARLGAGNSPLKIKRQKRNIFVFDFPDEIEDIIKSNTFPQGEFNSHTSFVKEAIFWYNRNK